MQTGCNSGLAHSGCRSSAPPGTYPRRSAIPSLSLFARFAGSMCVSVDDTIEIYDGLGFQSSPRVWWMFRIRGVFYIDVDVSKVFSLAEMRKPVDTGSDPGR